MKTPALEAAGLFFSYRAREPVLENLSFSLDPGQLIACIGPNGGGKTTLLRLLLGFLQPDRGTLRLFGRPVREQRSLLAYVPQFQRQDRLFPVTVEDVVLMGLLRELSWHGRFSEAQKEQARTALDQVGCEALLHSPFGDLSGGQAQRVLLARALVSKPKLLLLDEPTASVDPAAEHAILELLGTLRGETTVLLVTHDLHTAHRHVDQVLCINRTAQLYHPSHLCEHFSMGLYHPIRVGEVLSRHLKEEAPVS